jgi:hypothetical protein
VRILILTSKDHPYANYLLLSLLQRGAFNGDTLFVAEQDWIIPYKSTFQGVKRYVEISGWRYVAAQAVKQYLFRLLRCCAWLLRRKHSPLFPYKRSLSVGMTVKRLQDLRLDQTFTELTAFKPEVIFSLLSKEVIPDRLLHFPKFGCFNLHPSMLPANRGVSPTFWALANGEQETGCTLHRMDSDIDSGEIISQTPITVVGMRSEHALYMRCIEAGVPLVLSALQTLHQGKELTPILTGKGEASYHSLPTKKMIQNLYDRGFSLFQFREFIRLIG